MNENKNQDKEDDKCMIQKLVMEGYMQIQTGKVKDFDEVIERMEKNYQEMKIE